MIILAGLVYSGLETLTLLIFGFTIRKDERMMNYNFILHLLL